MKYYAIIFLVSALSACQGNQSGCITNDNIKNDSLTQIHTAEDSLIRLAFSDETVDKCNAIIRLISNNDINGIADLMPYPLNYQCLIIRNKTEFITTYKGYFDSLSIEFNRHPVRVNASTLYTLAGQVHFLNFTLCARNQISSVYLWLPPDCNQKVLRQQWRDSLLLYKPLQGFRQNILMCKTDSLVLRIDLLNAEIGKFQLRLAIWPVNASLSQKPDVVLITEQTNQNFGSLDLWQYSFTNEGASYRIAKHLTCGTDNGEQIVLSVITGSKVNQYRCERLLAQ